MRRKNISDGYVIIEITETKTEKCFRRIRGKKLQKKTTNKNIFLSNEILKISPKKIEKVNSEILSAARM